MTKTDQSGILDSLKRCYATASGKDMMKGISIPLAASLLAAGVGYVLASKSAIQLPIAGGMVYTIAAVFAFVFTILGWLVSTILFHFVSLILGGKGGFNKMIVLSGYAYTPMVIQHALRLVYFSLYGVTQINLGIGSIENLLNFFTVFSVLTMYLVGVAAMVNYGLSRGRATIVALSPTIIGIILALLLRNLVGVSNSATRGGILNLFGR